MEAHRTLAQSLSLSEELEAKRGEGESAPREGFEREREREREREKERKNEECSFAHFFNVVVAIIPEEVSPPRSSRPCLVAFNQAIHISSAKLRAVSR